jgi:hypothetical protein
MTQGLLAAGIRVAGVDRDREPLEALPATAREPVKAPEMLTIQTDLTNDSAADEIIKARQVRFGRIVFLIAWALCGRGVPRFLRPVELQPIPRPPEAARGMSIADAVSALQRPIALHRSVTSPRRGARRGGCSGNLLN